MSRKQNTWIPEHVVDSILQRLPMRSLARFKCVSKPWNSTTSKTMSKFLQNKKLILLSDKSLCIMNYEASTGEATKHSETEGLGYQNLLIRGSCNGLLLISQRSDYFLWNPLTGEKKSLAIHSYWESSAVGFGYDYSTNDYKIVSFENFSSLERIQVYSIRNDSDRILHNIPRGSLISMSDGVGKLVNNSHLYWLTFYRNHLLKVEDSCSLYWHESNGVDNNLHLVILGFNLVSESPMLLHYPSAAVTRANFMDAKLIDYKGSLGVIQTVEDTDIEMWVLKGEMHKVNWVKLLSVPRLEVSPLLSVITVSDDEALMVYAKEQKFSCCYSGGNEICPNSYWHCLEVNKRCLYSYNLTEKVYRKVKVHDEFKNWVQCIMFSGSMDSLPKSDKKRFNPKSWTPVFYEKTQRR